MSTFLYFWRDRFVWWFRLLLGIVTIGVCVLIGWLIPEWGNWGKTAFGIATSFGPVLPLL